MSPIPDEYLVLLWPSFSYVVFPSLPSGGSLHKMGFHFLNLRWALRIACSLVSLCPAVQARVEAAGGEIMHWNGERVMGVLAVSRAIGDHNLRPFVIAVPEVGPLRG